MKNLTLRQRYQLEVLLPTELTKKQIAERLGCCVATVYNEIKRGTVEQIVYFGCENSFVCCAIFTVLLI